MSTDFSETLGNSYKISRSALVLQLALWAGAVVLIAGAVYIFAGDARAGAGTAFILLAGVFAYGALAADWLQKWAQHRTDEHEDAKNEPAFASADKTRAEAEAIAGASVIQTINAGEGSRVRANVNTAPRVSVRGKSVSWNQITQLNQPAAETKRLEFPREDWLWMLEQFVNVKHSKRLFVNERAPYSQQPAYPELYNELIRILVQGEAIKGRAPKSAGALVVTDIKQLADMIEAEHPAGMVIDAAPTLLESVN